MRTVATALEEGTVSGSFIGLPLRESISNGIVTQSEFLATIHT
mgnify:FL=1